MGRGCRSRYRVHAVVNETLGLWQRGEEATGLEKTFKSRVAFLESEECKHGLWLG